jgi:hypothetical protein
MVRATSFNFAEQGIMQEIVAEGSAEHFAAESKPFFRDASLPQKIQCRFPQHIQILPRPIPLRPVIVFLKAYVQKSRLVFPLKSHDFNGN